MKKLFTILGLLVLTVAASAQQGSWYLGGTAGLNSNSTDQNNNRSTMTWNLSPEVGTWLSDEIQLGFALNLTGGSQKDDNGDQWKNSGFSPVIYVRKFWSLNEQLSVFVGLDLQYISGSTTNFIDIGGDITEVESKMSGFGANLNGGVAYGLSDRIAIVGKYGLLGWQSITDKPDPDDETMDEKSSDFTFGVNSLGPVFNIGIYWTMIPAGS